MSFQRHELSGPAPGRGGTLRTRPMTSPLLAPAAALPTSGEFHDSGKRGGALSKSQSQGHAALPPAPAPICAVSVEVHSQDCPSCSAKGPASPGGSEGKPAGPGGEF